MSTPHMWPSDGVDAETFSKFSQHNMSVKGLSVATRTANLPQINFMMTFCDMLINESKDFMNGARQ